MAIQCEMTATQSAKILAIVRAIACNNRLMTEARLENVNYDRGSCQFARRSDTLISMLEAYTGGSYWGSEVAEEMDKLVRI